MLKQNVYAELSAKKVVVTLLVLFCTSTLLFADYNGNVLTELEELSFIQIDEYDLIILKNGYFTEEIGAPKLPVKIKKYLIPLDMKPINISVTSTEQTELENQYYIYPAQTPQPTDGSEAPPFVEPIESIYNSDTPYPDKLIEIIGDECTMGYHVVTLRIFPLSYIPKQKKVNIYTDIDFTIEYESITTSIRQARRQSLSRYNTAKRSIKNMVENPNDFESVTGGAQEIIPGKTEMEELDLRFMPSLEGDTPEYIIITSEELKPVFDEFAEWKTKKGIPTLVITTEQIEDNYGGCDLAEKIRHYLQDARYYWGEGLYVLLGGDTNIVPDRLTEYPYFDIVDMIPSDLYYSDVYDYDNPNYNFNADGDNIFGESEDDLDYGFDLIVGRASVEDETEATTFVNKVISYEKLDNPDYEISDVKNLLLMSTFGYLIPGEPNYSYPDMVDQYNIYENNLPTVNVPNGWIHGWKMFDDYDGTHDPPFYNPDYPGHEETTHDHFVAALNNGSSFTQGNFHIVYHADHSSPYSMGTSIKMKHEVVNRTDMDNLENIPYQILMTCGCEPNRFNLDCICEHYINNPDHGGVAIVGNSCVGWCGDSDPQFKNFVINLYGTENNGWECLEYHMGSLFQTMNPYIGNKRESLNLLGDPEMPVWTNTPINLDVVVTPSEITNGENTITVTINYLPENVDALVCLQKGNEAYGHQSIPNIYSVDSAIFTFTPDTPGELDVTVTAHNYLPYEDTIPVNLTSGSHLYITEKTIDDDDTGSSYGNCDGQVDAGETIELSITLTNSGSADALDVSAELICDPEFITITQNQSNFGDINAGESAVSQINYIFEVDPDTPDGEYV
ncbi:MAG: hypothetical protein H8D22_02145 [Candidatus Cloacimonetes bacterium]|nr:hypothetical protein [Candidatus Cloacimonadota bacterium]